MIKEIPLEYDLNNPVLELKFQSELSKIVKHYDSLTIAEEAEAVKLLLGKINIPNVYNWIPIFNEMATGVVLYCTHMHVRKSYVHVRVCITLQDPGT